MVIMGIQFILGIYTLECNKYVNLYICSYELSTSICEHIIIRG